MKRTVLPLLVALCIAGLGGNVEAVKRPNFVIIFTDDQGYQDLGCYGSPEIGLNRSVAPEPIGSSATRFGIIIAATTLSQTMRGS